MQNKDCVENIGVSADSRHVYVRLAKYWCKLSFQQLELIISPGINQGADKSLLDGGERIS